MWSNELRRSKDIIYKLKRSYGKVAYLRKPTTNQNNRQTGEVVRTFSVYRVNKAVVLPIEIMKSFIYDLTYVAANKNFTYGAFFDKGSSFVLIDSSDLYTTIDESIDHLVIDQQKFEISKSEKSDSYWYMMVKSLGNTDPIVDPYAENQ